MHEPRPEADDGRGLPLDPDVEVVVADGGADVDGRGAAEVAAPMDASVEVVEPPAVEPPRPVHSKWGSVGLVALGGALGTAAREGVGLAMPAACAIGALIPVLVVNVTGAFALGLLLEALLRRGSDHGRPRSLRLLVGTGFLGGYTTYSSLAVDAGRLIDAGQPVLGLLYATLSVVAGAAAAFAGVAAAGALHRWQRPRRAAGA